jgi:hypothetical protein
MAQADSNHTTNASRRRFLAFTAAASAVSVGSLAVAALPAAATSHRACHSDPAFAAIEAHRASMVAYDTCARNEDVLEKSIPTNKRRATNWDEIVETDDPRWIEHNLNLKCLHDLGCDAESELCDIVPTTMAGVIALVAYMREVGKFGSDGNFSSVFAEDENDEHGQPWSYFALGNIAEALKTITAAASLVVT